MDLLCRVQFTNVVQNGESFVDIATDKRIMVNMHTTRDQKGVEWNLSCSDYLGTKYEQKFQIQTDNEVCNRSIVHF